MERRPWYVLTLSNSRFAEIVSCLCCAWIAACRGGSSYSPPPNNPTPSLSSLSPTSTTAGGAAFTLTVTGSNFISSRFTVPALATDLNYSLGTASGGPFYALDLQVAPGTPHTTAVSLAVSSSSPSADGGITIFDDATARPTKAPGFGGTGYLFDTLQWGSDATALYAANYEDDGFDFYTLSVNSGGVTLVKDYLHTFKSFSNRIHYDPGTKLVYANDGTIVDPATGAVVGTFAAAGPMVPDSSLNTAFFVNASVLPNTIEAFNLTTHALIASIPIPVITGNALRLIRWGQNGLAFNTDGGQLYLIGGNFVH